MTCATGSLSDARQVSSKENSAKLGLFSSVLGHVGDGNFHQMIMYNPHDPTQKEVVEKFVNDMVHKALEADGTVSVSLFSCTDDNIAD